MANVDGDPLSGTTACLSIKLIIGGPVSHQWIELSTSDVVMELGEMMFAALSE